MKTNQTLIFSEEDMELLKKELPDNPCLSCGINYTICSGCSESSAYKNKINVYRDRNIFDFAKTLKDIHKLGLSIKDMQNKVEKLTSELPEEVKTIIF